MGAVSLGQDGEAMAFLESGLLLQFRPNRGTSVWNGGRFPADGEGIGQLEEGQRTRYIAGDGNL